ncbi:hypothetical protein BKH30_02050 [Actinomyces oris]|uniref:Leucine rich repeat variant domain-containing protein n=1 Tax=Actinomyces oris TaxID=544580 RepID=A0A1Q8W3K9_9ACTO|nr:hypothetical protein BKH30_02050 [Actinomyces oris]
MTAVAHAAPGPADPDAAHRTSDDPDLQLAQDPRAGAGRLMVLAGNRPDLRGVIADNPGCSPELRAWVSRLGGVSAGSGGGGHRGPEAAAPWADGANDAVSLAPTAGSPPTSAWAMTPSAPSWVTRSWAHRSSTTAAL